MTRDSDDHADRAFALVGRTRERAQLAAALERARGGRGGCVLISGDAGIGKTALVRDLTESAPPSRVLWGRCHESSGAPAFWPWVQMLRAYVRDRDADDLRRELGGGAVDLGRILPALRERLPEIAEPEATDPDEARFLLFDAVAGLLRRATAADALVLVLEDLHWADRDSLLLLQHVAAELPGTRALVLATVRDAELRALPEGTRVLADLARVSERLPIGGLGAGDVGDLVRTLTGAKPAPELIVPLHRATDGNPFFVAEVVELLRAEGGLDRPAIRSHERFGIPDTVREAILRRLDPLEAGTRELLRIAAVLGREFPLAVVGEVAGRPLDSVLAGLERATDLGLVGPAQDRAGHYRFAHALLRRTLEDTLPAAECAELHLRVGEALERLHALDLRPLLGEIANHFFAAASVGGRERAIDYAYRAGRRALDTLGFEDALEHFARAVAALRDTGGDPRTLLKMLLWLGIAQRRKGAEGEARATLLEVARLARQLGDVAMLARAALNASGARAETGVVDTELLTLLEDALAALDARDTPLRAHLMGAVARCLYFTSESERREALSVEALAIARRTGDASALGSALEGRHFVLWRPGTTEERLALATEMVAIAERLKDRDGECNARTWRMLDLAELGRMQDVEEELALLSLAAEHLRSPRHRWQSTVIRASLALLAGRVEEAETLAVQAMSLRRAGATNNMQQFFAVQMYHVRRAQRRQAEVLPLVADAGRTPTLPIWRCGLAQLRAETGDLAGAREMLDELARDGFAAIPYDANWLPAMASLAETAFLTRAVDHAPALHERLLPHADRILVTGLTTVVLGPISRFLGLLALTGGDADEAVARLEDAVARCTSIGARLDLDRARAALADALVLRAAPGDAERARALRSAAAPTQAPPRVPGRTGALCREGDFWTLSCGSEVARLKGTKGVEYLAVLLANPGREVHALDLESGPRDAAARTGDAGEALDAEARQSYRQRLARIPDEAAAARRAGDDARAAALDDEARALEGELKRAVGLGGRSRRVGSDAERARVNVTRAIGSVLRKIAQSCPEVGRHLERRVATGTFCVYEPDADDAIDWQTSAR